MGVHKILVIMGTRPEAIKLAPVIIEFKRRSDLFVVKVCATAQHREMLDQVLQLFDIQPDYDLDVMTPGQSLALVTARVIQGVDEVLVEERPDLVMVQGDTSTVLCGALAAYYHRVPVAHVEAGLRTGNKYAPFPEEMNRRLVAPLTDYHFAPTERARRALLGEGISQDRVFVTGNTVIDALLWVRDRVTETVPALPQDLLAAMTGKEMILVTGHRRESFGEGFENICQAIRQVADAFPNALFVYPVHLNPQVREPVNRILGNHERIKLMDPLPYGPFVWLMDRAIIVLTDSGGVQEEAPSLGKPVLVMRELTERPEGVETGNARLVGSDRERIANELSRLLERPEERDAMAQVSNPYGDGQAAARIVRILADQLSEIPSPARP